MNKIYLAALALLIGLNASAQTFIGLKAGPAFTLFNAKFGSYNRTMGATFGGFVEHIDSHGIVVGAEMQFENRRSKSDVIYTDNLGNPISGASSFLTYSAVSVPLYMGFKSTLKPAYIQCAVGLIPAFNFREATTLKGHSDPQFNGTFSRSISDFDISPMVSAGAGISVNRFQIGLTGRYQQSLIGIGPGKNKSNGISAFLSVGYKL